MIKAQTESYASVWDALADTTEQAANLRVRSELMSQLATIIEANGWTQTKAAVRCRVTQPRINDLLRGRLSRFSLDALVNIAAAIGQHVHVELGAVARERVARTSKYGAPRSTVTPTTPTTPRPGKSRRLARRSAEEITKALDQAADVVKKSSDGLRAEQIRKTLKMRSKEMPRVLKEGLAKKKLRSKGRKERPRTSLRSRQVSASQPSRPKPEASDLPRKTS